MGQVQKTIQKHFKKRNVKVFMAGNPSSGRTTMLQKWMKKNIDYIQPTMGYNVERVVHRNLQFEFWDGGGGSNFRKLWVNSMQDVEALIVVVDSTELDQFSDELQDQIKILLPHLPKKDLPLLILANKNDKHVCTDQEIYDYVGISQYENQIKYHIIHTNSLNGEGLDEAIDWLYQQFQ